VRLLDEVKGIQTILHPLLLRKRSKLRKHGRIDEANALAEKIIKLIVSFVLTVVIEWPI